MLHGVAEAGAGSQAEHREGAPGREVEEDDPPPPESGAPGPQPAGREVPGPRRQARPEPRGPNPPGPLRGGQAEEHRRTFEHGEVGPDPGHPEGKLAPALEAEQLRRTYSSWARVGKPRTRTRTR